MRTDLQSLPSGWAWTTLGEITDPHIVQSPPLEKSFTYIEISSIDSESKAISAPSRLAAAEAPTRARQHLRAGDVIISMTRPNLNAVAMISEQFDGAIGSTGFCVLRPALVDSSWLLYITQSPRFIKAMTTRVQGVVYPAVRPIDIRSFVVPLPPLEEQRRLAAELDRQLTRISSASVSLRRTRANLNRYRAAVLKAACEGRLVPTEAELAQAEGRKCELGEQLLKTLNRSERNPVPEYDLISNLPLGWTTATVGAIAQVGTGATPRRSKLEYYDQGTIPWVTSSALNQNYVSAATELVTEKALAECNLTVYPPGTLLLAMYGEGRTRGKCSELTIAACTNQAIAALVTQGLAAECRPYLKIFLQKNYHDIRRLSAGGVQPNLNLSLVRNLTLPFPPLSEQRRITQEVSRILSLIDALEAFVERNLKRTDSLRVSILDAAFRGVLVPQNFTDEPASVLLERIRQERGTTSDNQPRRRGRKQAINTEKPRSRRAAR